MSIKKSLRILGALAAVVVLLVGFVPAGSTDVYGGQAQTESTDFELLAPDAASELNYNAPELSAQEQKALQEKVLAIREQYDALVDNYTDAQFEGLAEAYFPPTTKGKADSASEAYLPSPSAFKKLNRKLDRASGNLGSTLAEPSAINEGKYVFAAGNTHAEYSKDRAQTWTNVPIPGGRTYAPNKCCDIDVVYDRSRGLTIWSVLYLNGNATNGEVRIFVRRNVDTNNVCSYTINPSGSSHNTIPDYPHLGLGNNYLYLTLNNVGGAAGGNAQVKRFSLKEMAECVSTPTNTYTYNWDYGQRVFVPVEGATDTMYWGAHYNSSTFRIYRWPESGTTIFWNDRTISTSTFANPDCRGGTGNYDFIERSTSYSITGFRLRGAVSKQGLIFLWNAANDATYTQALVRAALFKEDDLSLIGQPHIWNPNYCFGYPAVSVNDRGDFGLTIAAGGRAGGGGTAAQGYVAIDDEFTPGAGYFQSIYKTATGTHNRTDGRFGDYFTIRRQTPCGMFFTATNYALKDGRAVSNVNSRYVEFGRGRDIKCWKGWSGRTRAR
jgi:hypothetical protein